MNKYLKLNLQEFIEYVYGKYMQYSKGEEFKDIEFYTDFDENLDVSSIGTENLSNGCGIKIIRIFDEEYGCLCIGSYGGGSTSTIDLTWGLERKEVEKMIKEFSNNYDFESVVVEVAGG